MKKKEKKRATIRTRGTKVWREVRGIPPGSWCSEKCGEKGNGEGKTLRVTSVNEDSDTCLKGTMEGNLGSKKEKQRRKDPTFIRTPKVWDDLAKIFLDQGQARGGKV